jgi:phosphate transport system permease protein
LSQEALAAVPSRLREAGIGLGASRAQVVVRVLVPAAVPGIVAAVVLAMARAMGETMTVTLAAGSQARVTLNPLEGVQTMTAFIAQVSMGDTPAGTIEHRTLFAVGTLLFAVTFALNVVARTTLRRYRAPRPVVRT